MKKILRNKLIVFLTMICFISMLFSLVLINKVNRVNAASSASATVKYYDGNYWEKISEEAWSGSYSDLFESITYNADGTAKFVYKGGSSTTAWAATDKIDNGYSDFTSATHLVVQVKNNSNSSAVFGIQFSGFADKNNRVSGTNGNEIHLVTKQGGAYYLVNKQGVVSKNTCGVASQYAITANFDGALVIPKADIVSLASGQNAIFECIKRANFNLYQNQSFDLTFGKFGYTENTLSLSNGITLNLDWTSNGIPVTNIPKFWKATENKTIYNDAFSSYSITDTNFTFQFNNQESANKTVSTKSLNADETLLSNFSGNSYVTFDVKNNNGVATDIIMYVDNGDKGFTVKQGGTYFLRDKNNNVVKPTASEKGKFTIPANFNGVMAWHWETLVNYDSGSNTTPFMILGVKFNLLPKTSGNLTFGNVGYTNFDTISNTNDINLNYVNKLTSKTAEVKYYANDFWNTVWNSSEEWFTGAFNNGASHTATTATFKFDYTNISSGRQAWTNDYTDGDFTNFGSAQNIVIDVKNNSASVVGDLIVFFSGYNSSNDQEHFTVNLNSYYHLKSEDKILTCQVSGAKGHIIVPAGFDGQLIIPIANVINKDNDSKPSMYRVRRINFEFSGGYSKGDLTFGKFGYTEEKDVLYGLGFTYKSLETGAVTTPDYKVERATVALEENINFKFGVKVNNGKTAPSYAVFNYRDGDTKVTEKVNNGGYYWFTLKNITPQYLDQKVKITVYANNGGQNGDVAVASYACSVIDYCELLLSDDSASQSAKKTAQSLIDYHRESKVYKNLATVSGTTFDSLPSATNKFNMQTTENSKITIKGLRLLFDNSVGISLAFTLNGVNLNDVKCLVSIGGNNYHVLGTQITQTEVIGGVTAYVLNFKKITSTQFDDEIKFAFYTVADEKLVSNVVTYSVNTFFANAKTENADYKLLQALYAYGYYAKQYFGN